MSKCDSSFENYLQMLKIKPEHQNLTYKIM